MFVLDKLQELRDLARLLKERISKLNDIADMTGDGSELELNDYQLVHRGSARAVERAAKSYTADGEHNLLDGCQEVRLQWDGGPPIGADVGIALTQSLGAI